MLTAIIIVFREMLEICLIMGIISAALNNLKNKKVILISGLIGGVGLSLIFALTISYISKLFDDTGQEMLNILILSLSIICINLTILWLNKHRKELYSKINAATQKLISQKISILALVSVIILVISREGAELILFLNGISASGINTTDLIYGSIIGLASGIALGMLMYAGLLKIQVKYFFRVINIMLILLTAGMASQLANYLSSADLIKCFSKIAWDSSWLIDEESFSGKLLYNLLGYSSRPTQLQVIFYVTNIAISSILLNAISQNKLNK